MLKKRIIFSKSFFKACLSTAHNTGADQQNSEICYSFYGKKTNSLCDLRYQNEYFDEFYSH